MFLCIMQLKMNSKNYKIILTMKKILVIVVFTFSQISFSQSYSINSLPKEIYSSLYNDVEKVLSKCVKNFKGTYKWGKIKMKDIKEIGNTVRIEGEISYVGNSCGNVTTDYYITFNNKTGIPLKWCIYTPYCFLAMQTSIE